MEPAHQKLVNNMKSCIQCSLSDHRSQVVVGDYGPKGGICFVGEAPGAEEDRQGRPFVGRSGQLLDTMLDRIGLSREDVSVLNIVKCRPPNNRNPSSSEQSTCGSLWLQAQLTYLQPRLLVTLGSVPLNYFATGLRITRVKGQLLTDHAPPIFPMFHPAYVLRGGATLEQYQQDFKQLLQVYRGLDDPASSSNPSQDHLDGSQGSSDPSRRTSQNSSQSSLDEFLS